MRGEFIGVWSEISREIWLPLIEQPLNDTDRGIRDDVYCELFRVIAGDPKKRGALKKTPSVETLADILDDPSQSRRAFEAITINELAGERELVQFFEAAHDVLDDFGGDALSNRYFNLLSGFIEKFSLRYDLRRPCMICPTLPGVFASLIRALSSLADRDSNVSKRLRDFNESFQDIRLGLTDARIGNCVSKQVMLLEAIASAGGAAGSDLGALCKSVPDWPHPAVRASLLSLYGFASDFPGLRHGTPSEGMVRDLDMRDVIAMSILLTGFTPHLTRQLAADSVYDGSALGISPATASTSMKAGGIHNPLTAQ